MTSLGLWVGFLLTFTSLFSFADEAPVRVRLLKSFKPIVLQANNLQLEQIPLTSSLLARDKWRIQRVYKDKQWQWQITDLKAKAKADYWLSQNKLLVTGDFIEINHQQKVPSYLHLVGVGKRADVVALVSLEKYLSGVVPNEMPLAWPEEALKAQAVASRSYTLSVIKERQHLHFDVEATVEDQVFSWLPLSNYPSQWRQKVLSVLNETRGQFLSHNGVGAYKAYFHADSGGQTEVARFVWEQGRTQPSFSVPSSYIKSPQPIVVTQMESPAVISLASTAKKPAGY